MKSLPANLPPREEVVASIASGDATDASLGILGALVSVFPFLGGPSTAALGEWRRARSDRQYAELLADMVFALVDVRDKVDLALLHTEEHTELVLATVEEATRGRQQAKRAYYVNGIVNASVEGHPELTESTMFMAVLDRCQLLHLDLIRALDDCPRPTTASYDYLRPDTPSYEVLTSAVPYVSPSLLGQAWEELGAWGVLEARMVVTAERLVDEGGDPPFTAFGVGFRAFLASPGGSSDTG